jgi:hypothetical protein
MLVTDRGEPYSFETSRLPHFPYSRMAAPAALCPHEDSRFSFLLEAESTQGHNAAGRIRSIEKIQ